MNNSAVTKPVKPQTITIDVKCKEFYYYASNKEAVKESPDELAHKHVFWNYMMNVSMHNTIAQMSKRRCALEN